MTTDTAQLLTLTQWLSPAFPIGAFAYSSGLEAAADAGWVHDGLSLAAWLEDALLFGTGRSDALILCASYGAKDVEMTLEIDTHARAFSASKERLKEAADLGKTFARALAPWPNAQAAIPKDACLPVALGAAARAQNLPCDLTQILYLQSWLTNLVAAGQRLAPVGQTDAQDMLRCLTPLCAQVARDTSHGDLDQLAASAFLTDIASMKHETQYSRIFRT